MLSRGYQLPNISIHHVGLSILELNDTELRLHDQKRILIPKLVLRNIFRRTVPFKFYILLNFMLAFRGIE